MAPLSLEVRPGVDVPIGQSAQYSTLGGTMDVSAYYRLEGLPLFLLDGSGTGHAAGDTFIMPAANVTLYANWNSKTWHAVSSAGLSAESVSYVSLALGATDTPFVAYEDPGYGGRSTLMKYTGTGAIGWEPAGSEGISAGGVTYLSLSFNSADTLYIVCAD